MFHTETSEIYRELTAARGKKITVYKKAGSLKMTAHGTLETLSTLFELHNRDVVIQFAAEDVEKLSAGFGITIYLK